MAILGSIIAALAPKVIGALVSKVANAKVKTAVVNKSEPVPAGELPWADVSEKPWWQSRAILGAGLLVASVAGRWFGFELTGTQIDQGVEMVLAILVMVGRARAVK